MTKNNVLQLVAEELRNRGYEVFENEVAKTNEVKKSLSFHLTEGQIIAPTFYEDFLLSQKEEGLSIEEIADELVTISRENVLAINIEELSNPNFLKEHAYLAPCNAEWNSALLSDAISEKIKGTDLANYVRIDIGSHASVKVTKSMLAESGLSQQELLESARENSHNSYNIKHISEFLGGTDLEMPFIPLMVISNENNVYGASCIADTEILANAAETLGCDELYIIPASIHEVLVFPVEDGLDVDAMTKTIQSINASDLKAEDVLSDHPYHFANDEISIVQTKQPEKVVGRSR